VNDTSISRAVSLYDALQAAITTATDTDALYGIDLRLGYSTTLTQGKTVSVIRGQGGLDIGSYGCGMDSGSAAVIVEIQVQETTDTDPATGRGTQPSRRNAYLALHGLEVALVPLIKAWAHENAIKQQSIIFENDADTTAPVYKAELVVTEEFVG
jgi:hypothetical protein